MAPDREVLTVAIQHETGRLVYVNKSGEVSAEAVDGAVIRFDHHHPYEVKFAKRENSSVVQRLPFTAILPERMLSCLGKGRPEEFRANLGFVDPGSVPDSLTMAVWVAMKGKKMSCYEFIPGGADLHVFFTLSKWLGKDGRSSGAPDTIISLTQSPNKIRFKRNQSTSGWVLMSEV